MKYFPDKLKPENKENFESLNYDRVKCYLRRDLYEHIISNEEKDYFELDRFDKERINDMEKVTQMINELIPELEKLGWKCQLSFGGTGLFIFENEPPSNCYPDGF
jgi:hypothetical protein